MYVIIGANGFLGSYITRSILEETNEKVICTARNIPDNSLNNRVKWQKCDISNHALVDSFLEMLKRIDEPLKVVFLAAYHHPDEVDRNFCFAWNINVTSLSYMINSLQNVSRLFYASTDSVYGESENNYHFTEQDKTNPVNRYGRQKVVAEQIVLGYGYNVVRFPFLIGESLVPQKKHFYDIIVETLHAGKPIEMFSDSYRSTITFNDAATLLITLMESEKQIPAVLNICADNDMSKYDVGLMIADKLGVSKSNIIPISVDNSGGIFKTMRAKSTLMDNSLIKSTLGLTRIDVCS